MTSSQQVEHIGTLIIILVSTGILSDWQTHLEDMTCDLIGSRETVRYGLG